MASNRHHIFLALSNPAAGREAEFNRWYDAYHLQDVVDLAPGFTRGRRYLAADGADAGRHWTSLAIYNLEADDVAELHRAVTLVAPDFTPSNGVFDANHSAWVFTPAGQAVAADDWVQAPHGGGFPPRLLALAFGVAPIPTDPVGAIDGVMRGHRFVRHADQRAGVAVPWDHLTLFELDARRPETIDALAGATGAGALWVYRPVGGEHVTAARPPKV